MPESPLSSSAYEVLGVAATASDTELKRAFRRALRQTHPDTGGDPQQFAAVQRAWDQVGSPEKRRRYDSGRGSTNNRSASRSPFSSSSTATQRQSSRPRARTFGHPGGWRREKFLNRMSEWVGRGVEVPDPYEPTLVRSAPTEIRRILADALAEESTARIVSELGIGFTVWHDVSTGTPERKIDHIVLGPTGLYAMLSEDFGGAVKVRRGELIGPHIRGEKPMHELAARAKILTRSLKVRFSCYVIVVPDEDLAEPHVSLGKVKGSPALAVRQSVLAHLLRTGPPEQIGDTIGGNELFDVRTRLSNGIRFVE